MRLLASIAGSGLACALAGAPALAQKQRDPPTWWARAAVDTTKHYRVKTDVPRKDAQEYGRHLDVMYGEYARRLSSFPARHPEKLDVFIFATQDEYARTLKQRFDVNSTGTAGLFFVNQHGSGLAFWIGSVPKQQIHGVIQHEAFHQFAYSRFGADLPIWVNEGLAEFFGNSVVVGTRLKSGQATPDLIARVRRAAEAERHVPFREMLTMPHQTWNDLVAAGEASGLYEQAWSMVHFLANGDGNAYRQPFEAYLQRINQRVPARAAFNQVFGSAVEPFEREWKAYVLEKLQPSPLLTVLERIEFLAEGMRALIARPRGEDEKLPESLDELRDALRAIDFEHHVVGHGRVKVLSAANDAMFTVPAPPPAENAQDAARRLRRAPKAGDAPHFAVEATRASRRVRNPIPPEIRTANFEPDDLVVRWTRDRKTRELRYEIVSD